MRVPERIQTRTTLALAVAATVLLSGCATSYVVDNQVQTFSELRTVPQPATYRFERLPSQQSAAGAQAQLEAAAEPALAKAGWVRNEAAARYSVLIGSDVVSTTQLVDPWVYSRFGPWGPYYGRRWAGGAGFYGWGPYWSYRYDMWDRSYAQRQVSVVIRDLSNQQVVYETRAVHESRWPNDPSLLAPMFDAALSSFPQPPAGVRQVNIEIPLKK
ncbi:hypothetical protein GCM10007320_37870 [Pseudorhodoferax aquiterrae]|uniref:DUF4136 domain-containing protein n=1 Tax=Pseudorhodoferax aquiterrae TaxID=747304 RepID=A0ABQ3G6B6_9BURK|nr:DUF4136 domain-containing protein [Pseudorhodoferax aquiterrae]GHC89827.1 hypothetical protein GCM10007320_37870 [Pseudorhodoferax aquiterrae]